MYDYMHVCELFKHKSSSVRGLNTTPPRLENKLLQTVREKKTWTHRQQIYKSLANYTLQGWSMLTHLSTIDATRLSWLFHHCLMMAGRSSNTWKYTAHAMCWSSSTHVSPVVDGEHHHLINLVVVSSSPHQLISGLIITSSTYWWFHHHLIDLLVILSSSYQLISDLIITSSTY